MKTLPQLPDKRVPILPIMSAPGTVLTRTTLRENLTDARIQYSSLCALEDRYHPDGLFTFMDLSVEAECLGLPISFPDHDPPSVRSHPVKDRSALEAVEEHWKGVGGRMPVFLRTMERLSARRGCPHLGHIIGPLTLAGELMGVADLAVASIEREEFLSDLLDFTRGVVSAYGKAMLDAGADLLCVLEPSAVIFSPEKFEKYCLVHFRALQRTFQGRGILHVCGNTTPLLAAMAGSEAFGLSLDSKVDFRAAIGILPPTMRLIGNIDPVSVFLQGTPRDVEKSVSVLTGGLKDARNFILSSGCDLPADVPLENLDAFFTAGRNALR